MDKRMRQDRKSSDNRTMIIDFYQKINGHVYI